MLYLFFLNQFIILILIDIMGGKKIRDSEFVIKKSISSYPFKRIFDYL